MFAFIFGFILYLCTRTLYLFSYSDERTEDNLHPGVSAETTLYIPGTDEQPLSVQQIGTDSHGRTSWVIGPGTPTGTFTELNVQFTGEKYQRCALVYDIVPANLPFSHSRGRSLRCRSERINSGGTCIFILLCNSWKSSGLSARRFGPNPD